jgi:hypothetical protein
VHVGSALVADVAALAAASSAPAIVPMRGDQRMNQSAAV